MTPKSRSNSWMIAWSLPLKIPKREVKWLPTSNSELSGATVDGSEIRCSPVGDGSLPHYKKIDEGFYAFQLVQDFFHQQYRYVGFRKCCCQSTGLSSLQCMGYSCFLCGLLDPHLFHDSEGVGWSLKFRTRSVEHIAPVQVLWNYGIPQPNRCQSSGVLKMRGQIWWGSV